MPPSKAEQRVTADLQAKTELEALIRRKGEPVRWPMPRITPGFHGDRNLIRPETLDGEPIGQLLLRFYRRLVARSVMLRFATIFQTRFITSARLSNQRATRKAVVAWRESQPEWMPPKQVTFGLTQYETRFPLTELRRMSLDQVVNLAANQLGDMMEQSLLWGSGTENPWGVLEHLGKVIPISATVTADDWRDIMLRASLLLPGVPVHLLCSPSSKQAFGIADNPWIAGIGVRVVTSRYMTDTIIRKPGILIGDLQGHGVRLAGNLTINTTRTRGHDYLTFRIGSDARRLDEQTLIGLRVEQ